MSLVSQIGAGRQNGAPTRSSFLSLLTLCSVDNTPWYRGVHVLFVCQCLTAFVGVWEESASLPC